MKAAADRPFGLSAVAVLLIVIGCVALVASLASARENSLYDWFGTLGAAVMVVTGTLMLTHQRAAVRWALVCAILLTLDRIHDGFAAMNNVRLSFHPILLAGRMLFNIALYWVAYEWFKRWREGVDASPETRTDGEWWPTKSEL